MRTEHARAKLKASILKAYRDYPQDVDEIVENQPAERVQTRSSERASRVSPEPDMASLSITTGANKRHHSLRNVHSPLAAHRTKRRKTRAERDKLRSKTSKHKEVPDVKPHKNVQESKDVTVTRINLTAMERMASSAVTQNRLTRRLGLFNKVKTSDTILREPLVVPDSVKKKANDDLKKVIGPGGDANFYTIDLDSLGKRFADDKDEKEPTCGPVVTPQPSSARSSYSLTRSRSPQLTHIPEAMEDSPESLPSSPDMADIAEKLQSTVDLLQHFPGKHYKQHIREGLAWLLKENAPADVAPNITPIKGALVAQSAKRNLTDSMSPSHTQDCGAAPMECSGSRMNSPDKPLSPHLQSHSENLQEVVGMDARSLFGYNDKVRSSQEKEASQENGLCQVMPPNGTSSQYQLKTSAPLQDSQLDGRKQQATLQAQSADRCYFIPQREDLAMYAYPVMLGEQQIRHPQVGDRSAVVAQYLYPDLPVDLSKTSFARQFQDQEERMDILDVLDQESQLPGIHDAASLLHQHQLRFNQANSQCDRSCRHGGGQQNLKCYHGNYPDQSNSPVWPKGSAHVLQKPNLDTPSPPDKMYPRRLY